LYSSLIWIDRQFFHENQPVKGPVQVHCGGFSR